ncbi:MAG: hypothetical protein LC102_07680 [Ignavibacteriales bacterium]|nr:MAG: hypothetical protein F9K26_07960 [Ignavibacteriaceae bacterium]MBW7873954.1 hypothetical protein [Ignavibacteria bacterium]MBZ0196187.1 hypothetical protein [Ignavibacteriaceae bacterium]MCZ2143287.1 hypothetical protein [Ignavibacteriales bacterium]WKZ72385.1 MAG: hypothetical protein QY308_12235 [Ignavibacteriaceae bacterium]
MKKNNNIKEFVLLFILAIGLVSFGFRGNDKGGKGGGKGGQNTPSLKAGDSYRMFINNLNIPLNRAGVIGDVSVFDPEVGTNSSGGRYAGITFLFSGGFFLSGITNGTLWSNAVASASRIQDYVPGTVQGGQNDPRAQVYVLRAAEGDFAPAWDEWKDAVALGAYFYDGDGDGIYDPVDKNGNGKWDRDEDRPDLIGDETAWCVYSDGTEPANRRFNDVSPQGIEIRQSVFAFNTKSFVGNMIFLRYSILNTGTVADVMDSVYFGVWADPDLGDAYDDLVGCDTLLNAGYVYNNGPDAEYGTAAPTFLIDFFQGPKAYIEGETYIDVNGNHKWDDGIDTPLDTAHYVGGQVRGIEAFPGAKNLGLASFVHYIQSHPTHGDPNTRQEARNYMLGLNRTGTPLDPCTWAFGEVRGGVDCAAVDPRFSYSGDPVANVGWINNNATDQRQMSNTGPFKLEKGVPVDIVAGYVLGRGTDAKNSVKVAKDYSEIAQLLFDSNFPSPPPPPPVKSTVQTGTSENGQGYIDLNFPTAEQLQYRAVDTVLNIDRRVEGFYITAYRTNSKERVVAGVENAKVVARYKLDDQIQAVYTLFANGNQEKAFDDVDPEFKLNYGLYSDPETGRLRVKIKANPFTDEPLVKGQTYYLTITAYALNHQSIFEKAPWDLNKQIRYGAVGDYIARAGAIEEYETALIPVVYGENMYVPATEGSVAEMAQGPSSGKVQYVVADNKKLTGDTYNVEFFKNEAVKSPYSVYYRLRNKTTNTVLRDSLTAFDTTLSVVAGKVTDGFLLKVSPSVAALGTATYSGTRWYRPFAPTTSFTGVFYTGGDIPSSAKITLPKKGGVNFSTFTSADKMRRIELRFGTNSGKAYRYMQGFVGTTPARRNASVLYAGGVTAADTVATRGGWMGKFGQGFVDVPFTAWAVDTKYGEQRQLAVGFIEMSTTIAGDASTTFRANPDGNWDPGDSVRLSGEYIVIFDKLYDPNGNQKELTGGDFGTGTPVWADLCTPNTVPGGADPGQYGDAFKSVFGSPWLAGMYVVGLQKMDSTVFYNNGDTLKIPLASYPYVNDIFTFTTSKGGDLSADQKQALFDKVNVYPNPLFAYNPQSSFSGNTPDNPYVTFTNLPVDVTVKIFSLSGILVRTLTTADKPSPTSPFLKWDLMNEDNLRVASGMYLAIVKSPEFGEKILKFAVIMPQKQIQRF